jgi:uncharacterized membrane protein
MSLESSKNLGGIGAILMIVGVLATMGYAFAGVLSLVGIILLMIGLKGMADHFKEPGIFNNALYAIIIEIIGVVIAVAVIVIGVLMALTTGFDWANPNFTEFTDFSFIWNSIGAILAGVVVLMVMMVIAALFFRKSFSLLAGKTGEKLFETAGLLMLIGAVLTIIVLGLVIVLIAWILVAVAFFQVKEQAAPTAAPPPPP